MKGYRLRIIEKSSITACACNPSTWYLKHRNIAEVHPRLYDNSLSHIITIIIMIKKEQESVK